MNKTSITVFGEIHTNAQNVKTIEKKIVEIKPHYLLHELLYEDRCNNVQDIKQRLAACKEGGICDPRINRDIYKLGLRLDTILVGIDLDDTSLNQLSIPEQFAKREKHMAETIESVLSLPYQATVVIVVGDTHLRERGTAELPGPSPLIAMLRRLKNVHVERAPASIREMD